MFRKILLQVVFLVIAGYAVDLKAQPAIIIVNPKGCLDADPETAELDSCPPGAASPWSTCPAGACMSSVGDSCIIPAQNINFSQWTHFTNGYYYNPPEAAPDAQGKAPVEVTRQLCSYHRACPCKRNLDGTRSCTMVEYSEEWLIKYARSNSVICI